jgi:penicillin-binding protein 1A
MSEETAYLMIELMKGVVESGTGARLRSKYGLTNPIAGKTGTTDNNSDGWFMGITPNLVRGVWVGVKTEVFISGAQRLGKELTWLYLYGHFYEKSLC